MEMQRARVHLQSMQSVTPESTFKEFILVWYYGCIATVGVIYFGYQRFFMSRICLTQIENNKFLWIPNTRGTYVFVHVLLYTFVRYHGNMLYLYITLYVHQPQTLYVVNSTAPSRCQTNTSLQRKRTRTRWQLIFDSVGLHEY